MGTVDGKALVNLVLPREEKRAQAEANPLRRRRFEAERAERAAKLEKGRVAPQDMVKPN